MCVALRRAGTASVLRPRFQDPREGENSCDDSRTAVEARSTHAQLDSFRTVS
jgi:hypothetical protein